MYHIIIFCHEKNVPLTWERFFHNIKLIGYQEPVLREGQAELPIADSP
ncbi:hypothetical protein CHCC4186_3210 [Bacillus paralicheniformis]|nr:hypothetical protein CHCC4186_3210 [Bacillus paralicheniformis]